MKSAGETLYKNQPGNVNTNAGAKKHASVPVKTAKMLPGNQGTKNSHTQPGTTKPVGSDSAMRKASTVTSTSTLQKLGGNKIGDKKGASNAARVLYGHPVPRPGMKA